MLEIVERISNISKCRGLINFKDLQRLCRGVVAGCSRTAARTWASIRGGRCGMTYAVYECLLK